jgi:hypothetical protein
MNAVADNAEPPNGVLYDVVVVSYNQRERLLACLAAAAAAKPAVRLIVIDNASVDGSAEAAAAAHPDADVIALPENVGFAAAVNRGAAIGEAPYILLLNNDARLGPGALEKMRRALDNERVAAVGPRLLGPDGQIELSLDRTLSPWNEARFRVLGALYGSGRGPMAARVRRRYETSRDVLSLSGACILLKREAFDEADGFDQRFFLYAEDVDLCLRLRQSGWRLRYVADAVVEHDRGASSATAPAATALHYRRSQIAFYRKHRGALATRGLRLYLACRFAIKRLFARGEDQRRLAADLLRCALHESDE